MLKKIGIPVLTLAAMLVLIPAPQAKAGVRFGVVVGAPAYVAPAPVYPPPYVAPAPVYAYPAPVYVAPYAAWGWGHGHYFGHAFAGRGRR